MKNKEAINLIDNILKDLDKKGINKDALIDNLIELRTYALEAEIPLVVKVLRLTYTHIQENDTFLIPILNDEPIEEEVELSDVNENSSPVDSLKYLISLIKNLNNKANIADLKEYRDLLNNY